ncbi:hypothetical protein F5J12DRAFT_840460, partial [Pisolithus orientalis]|uniref:uncharacterized protein n=1 Tax=Pisolithus orientalis TaxID=936130 RepID=UPI0022246420
MWNMKTDREILFNLGTRGEARGYQGEQTLHDAHESLSPFSNCTPSSSQGLLAGAVPTSAYPPFVPDIVDGTTTNVRMIPLPPDRTVLHHGGGDTHERMDRSCHASGKMALLSYSNGPRHQAQLCTSCASTMSVLSAHHVDSTKTAAIFGHHDCVQSGPNYHISQLYSPNAGPVIPAQHVPTMASDQVNEVPSARPALFSGYLEPLNGGARLRRHLLAVRWTTLATANMTSSPSEASQIHPSITGPSTFATSELPQQEGVCNELVHLASSHGVCGGCRSPLRRKSFLKHFRVVELGF